MIILGCEFENINAYDKIKCWIEYPVSREKVFFVPDACCMLKLAKKNLGNERVLLSAKKAIN